jgi:hypothetical protein
MEIILIMNWTKTILANIILLCFVEQIFANEKVQIGGNFLSVFNVINEKDQPKYQNKRTQFDVAGNLDISWNISSKIAGAIQLQSSAGEGTLGFATNQVALTDINLQIELFENFALTAGSFDTPFGSQTAYLTNNADATNNILLLNSLFYSALAGTNVGTLNTVGAMLEFNSNNFQSTLALTNGTYESAFNPDGNFELVAKAGYNFQDLLFLSTSVLVSDDTSASGGAGLTTNLGAIMLDGSLNVMDNLKLAGYFGKLSFDDGVDLTDDEVTILMAEGRFYFSPDFHIAARLSMWTPEDKDGSGNGHSKHLVLPGFNGTFGSETAILDQQVSRLQIGLGYNLMENLQLQSELFIEDYKKDNSITGLILALNASFN